MKVFNNIFFKHLGRWPARRARPTAPTFPSRATTRPAKAAVTEFLDSIGYGAVDAGTLADSWRQEPGSPAYGAPYGPFENESGTPASADAVRAALAAPTR